MKDDESQNTDMSAKPVDTSTLNRLEFEINGQKMWMDLDMFQAQQKFMEEQEAEMWRNVAKQRKEWFGDQKCWCEDGGEQPNE